MKKLFTLTAAVLLIIISQNSKAQTTLSAGDVALVGINSDNPDKFSIVLLKDIVANTVINFTDNGFTGNNLTGRTGEGFLTYTAPAAKTAGTILSWTNGASNGSAWSSNNPSNFSFNAGGDQLFVFQGNTANWASQSGITLLFGINYGTALSGTSSNANTLQPNTSILPATAWINLPSSKNANGYFANGTSSTSSVTVSGTSSALLALIVGTNKWFGNWGFAATFPTWNITVCTFPTSVTASSNTPVCSGATLSLTASATGATSYLWTGPGGFSSSSQNPIRTNAITAYSGTYTLTATNSCGSTTITTSVTVNPLPTVSANSSATIICAGTSVTLSGTGASTYAWTGGVNNGVGFIPSATATYTVTGTDSHGCTNTATKTITVNPLPTVGANASATTVCAGTSVTLSGTGASTYAWTGGVTNGAGFIPSATTTYTITGTDANGCTNTATKTITIKNNSSSTTNHIACDSYLWNATTYTATGTYSYNTTNAAGCDSTATLNLTINNSSSSNTNQTACNSYLWNATTYTATGTYTYNTNNAAGCDSTATLNLTINNSSSSSTNQTACNSYLWNATTYTATGTYTYNTTNAAGCDSTATLNLTINNSSTSTTNQTACNSYLWNATTYTATGTYTYHTSNAAGCDSTATLNLTINNSSTSSTNQTACNSYLWNATTYTATGTYTYNTTNAAGCDSTATLNLTINNSSSSSTNQTACNSYLWNATTYTATGTYTYHTTNTAGCDSTATLNLTINNSSSSTTNQTACNSYLWNATTYTATGTYTYHTTNTAGCDSTATLNLTINNSSSSTTNQTACNSYLWNATTYTASGTYTYNTTNTAGCDSTATLNLTINNSSSSSTNQTACNSYLWNATTYTASGTYTYNTTNAAGCDSIATLVLIINPLPSVVATASSGTVCAGTSVTLSGSGASAYAWTGGVSNGVGFIPTATTTYTVTGTNANGCSNTAIITITVNPVPVVSFTLAANYDYNVTVSLTGSPVGGTFSGPGVSGNTFTPATAGVGGPYTIIYSYTDANGCSNTVSHQTSVLAAYTGPSSSATPYVLPVSSTPGVTTTAILSTPDVIGGYEMEGIPDGLGAFDNDNGTFTLLMNHELQNSGSLSGVTRAHGSKGAFVSKWIINKTTLAVQSGSDLMQNVNLWNTGTSSYTTYNASNPSAFAIFGRFCSADLPQVSAFYNSGTGMGTQERIFMNGEETNDESRAMAHIVTGPNGGTSWELPACGKAAWENAVANSTAQNKTIVALDNDGTDGQVYMYIGTKTNTGTEVERAGLTNGHPWGVKVTGFPVERVNSTTINNPPVPGTHFDLVDLGDVRNITGAAFNTLSNTNGVTKFSRPEDGAWDPNHPNDYYFNTTDQLDQVNDGIGAQVGRSRVWRLRFANILQPELGGTVEAVLDGTEGINMLDNMAIDHYGHILLQEDVGNAAHNGKMWQYTIATDNLKQIAKHDPSRFGDIGLAATAPFNQDEETSGIIDVQEILGPGMFLSSDQAHYTISGAAAEGGQLFALFNPDTYNSNLCATTSSTTASACASYFWNGTTYTSSGAYIYHTSNVAGCDSAVTLNLTITPPVPSQPGTFTTKTTFVYQGQIGVTYTVPNNAAATYSWSFSGTGATINGSGNSVTVDYSPTATSGTLSVTANNLCGASGARTLAIAVNTPITVPTTNYDYSFVTLGCNRVDYLDTTFTTGDPDYSCGASTANVYQLKRVFTEISHLNPLPKFLIMTGDIVMGYLTPSTPDTTALAKQLTAWKAIYESHPLSSMGITLIAIPGNHETQDKAAGKHSFVAAENIFTRIMAPYIHGSNGPGVGGLDGLTTDQSKLTYSFNYGGDHYIIIDTDPVGKDGITPYKWIAGDIQTARANHARHIFTFGHKPAYSSPYTPQGGLDAASTVAQRDSLWKYLENNNCEAMFSAHEHLWDSIHPHVGKTWQVINGDGGTRVETPWVGPGKQYYGYTLVNLYTDRKVNVMGLGRNTAMSPTVGTAYPINEDASPTTVKNNFNICLTTTSTTSITACDHYAWNATTYTATGTYTYTTSNAAGCDSIATLVLVINPNPAQPAAFTASTATVTAGTNSVVYTVPNDASVTYSWNYSGTGAAIHGTGNSITVDFSTLATSGTLSVTATNSCGTSAARSIAVTVNGVIFTQGRIVVIQTAGSIAKGGSAVTLKEYSTNGTAGVILSIPATGSTPLQIAAGAGGSEGFLTRSTDGTSLVLAGFSTSATGIADITITSASSTPRVVFKVDALGNYTQVGSSSTFYTGNDIRGAISDGANYWASGASNATDGINYYGPGTQTALAVGAKAYGLQIFNGQIYYSTQKTSAFNTTFGIFTLGGLPISGTVTPVQVINTGSAIPEDFSFNPAGDVCYIAINLNTSVGGIQKWTKSGGVWSLAYTLGTGVSNIGAYGLVVDYSGLNPILYATTFESNTVGNRVIKITDAGSGSTATTLATSAANTWFHGIAFSPSCPTPDQPAAFLTSSSMVSQGQTGVSYSVPNDTSVTYSWNYSGNGATVHGTGNSVTVDFSSVATNGTLLVTASNACGISAARAMSVIVNGNMRITEYMYNGAGTGGIGEFVELTNVGGASVNMTGWSFDDNSRTPGSQSLSAFGTVQPGESVILTDNTATAFRNAWNLCAGIKITGGNTNNLGRADEINIYDASNNLIDRLTYDDQTLGGPRTSTKSAWVSLAGLGANSPAQWTLSSGSDSESSFTNTTGDVGSPGKSTRATVSFDPCIIINTAPTIVMNVTTTSNYLDGGAAVSPLSPYGVSGTINDPTDPATTLGIDFTINDAETAVGSLTVTASSSNTVVVPTANLNLTGSGASRNIKITPSAVGYSNITITVNDGMSSASYLINYAASAASATPANTLWQTGMSDASDAIAIDDNFYITGDDELNVLNVYSRSASGLPLVSYDYTSNLNLPDPSKPEVDLEAATKSTTNPNKIYWLGSMSNGKAPFDNKPNRNRLFATTISGTGASTIFAPAGYYGNLRATLVAWGDAYGYNFTASAAAGVDSKAVNGFAAEGMVFGPDNSTLYIGMRAPLVPTANRTKAVIAPILNFETWFNNGSPSGDPSFGAPIELNLANRGIRELTRLSNGTYIILAGNYAGDPTVGAIYKWTGNAADAPVLVDSTANASLNMEGVMQVNVSGQLSLTQLQVITDKGGDILYNDGTEAKDFGDLNLRKFRSDNLSSLDLILCQNTFSSTTQNACSSYVWNGTTYTVSGTYMYSTTNAGGCDSIATLILTIDTASVLSTITPSGSTVFCQASGGFVDLTASSGVGYSYLWSTGETIQTIHVVSSGNYSVTVMKGSCSATSMPVNVMSNILPSDIDENGIVENADFLLFLAKFGTFCTGCREDLDQNGVINNIDFLIFLGQFNQICQ